MNKMTEKDIPPPDLKKLTGLNPADIPALQNKFGRNVLPTEKLRSAWGIFFSQFKSPLIYIILVAALISLVTQGIPDGDYGEYHREFYQYPA